MERIESAVQASIKEEFFNKIRPKQLSGALLSTNENGTLRTSDVSDNLLKTRGKDHPLNGRGIPGLAQQTITPYFTVNGADSLMSFLVAAFGATIVKESRYDDGRVQHTRFLIGNSLIMLNECTDDYPANISQMHIYVDNADEAYQTALGLGAASLMGPNDRPHGDRMAGIKDPCGNIWWLASNQNQRTYPSVCHY